MIKTKDKDYNGDTEKIIADNGICLPARSCDLLYEVVEEANNCSLIAIDDGQFFSDIIDFSEDMANRGKIVIVACLDSDFRRNPFGATCDLISKAENITKLSSICFYCGQYASFSLRISNETALKIYGGLEKYKPVCRTCYFNVSEAQSS